MPSDSARQSRCALQEGAAAASVLDWGKTVLLAAPANVAMYRTIGAMMTSRFMMKARRLVTRGLAGLIVYGLVLRPRQLKWGTTGEEAARALPGDDLLADADLTATRGITIRRRAAEVWPWITQLGQGRGGFYSYDGLENLVGCAIHSADRVVPEWQEVCLGDRVRLTPEVGLAVAVVDPARALVLRGGVPMGRTPPPYDFTWAFVSQERPDGTTRLLVRERYRYTRWWAALLIEPVALLSFMMSQKMLRGIRDRAEGRSNAEEAALEGTSGHGLTSGDVARGHR
jgi:hypothetical protein